MRSAQLGTAAASLLAVAAVLWPAVPAAAPAPIPAPGWASAHGTLAPVPLVVCGTDATTGLGVSAERAGSCAVALRVAAAYTRTLSRTRGAPTEVRAAGATWVCRERQGDPHPYQECLDTGHSGRRVTLTS
ncbi:hypothetical protein ACFV7Q_11995 [Streptomyces sp. NPDC059851]|uniref:hypothetical protein n=1 Tax=Streptomyces sp. NPDC059851 TaxID=3346971 RepID=UPI00364F1E49